MNQLGPWVTEDFESLSWHDVHVHGIRLDSFNPESGCADLILDIDYILEWQLIDGSYSFRVSPATLRFHHIFGLRIAIDYAQISAGMCPFSINGIERQPVDHGTDFKSYRWRIPINWPKGEIEFDAPGFTQTLTGTPRLQSNQSIKSGDRS